MENDRVTNRAEELLPEERTAGSDDPQSQAEVILDESDDRQESRDEEPDEVVERRSSVDVTPPPD
jgi:hypothetical protein